MSDLLNPTGNLLGGIQSGTGGTVDSVVAGTGLAVDSTNPSAPIVSAIFSSQAEAEAGVSTTTIMSPARVKNATDLSREDIPLGDGSSTTNPSREGEVSTGLFSPATGVVGVSSLGIEALRVTADRNVGVGTTSPSAKLDIFQEPKITASSAGAYMAGYAHTSVGEAHSYTGVIYGSVSRSVVSAEQTAAVSSSYGSVCDSYNNSGQTVTAARGIHGSVSNQSSGTISSALGSYGSVTNSGTGVIASASGLQTKVDNTGSGSITTGYGLYIGPVAGTTNYGVYQSTDTNKNYFAGNVGVGVSPNHKLQVTDTATTDGRSGLVVAQTGAITGMGYGAYIAKTGASTTNVGLYVSASGATNNYGLIVGAGQVGVGTTTPTTGTALDMGSNTGASNSSVLLPKGTTANRPVTGVSGMIRYNTTTSAFEAYGTAWGQIAIGAIGTPPAYALRAWVKFNVSTGTPVIATGGNVSSITDGGVGIFTANFTEAFPDVSYGAVICSYYPLNNIFAQAVGSVQFNTRDAAGVYADPQICNLMVVR